MNQVEGEYKDIDTKYFYLNADQAFNPYTWESPIIWKGTVNGKSVEFVQIEDSGDSITCFDWTNFPQDLEAAKLKIVKAIDDAMRVMD
ncbi:MULTISPECIES: hypothetical protein [Sphingobacterium]|uniref:hypothetical protein n=1 Tax=Sphingobacterium TaxID=28453 RepID=UPI0010491B61|nr:MULTISPECIES: hypothetical protein [Sphingobacterium]MCW2259607.1 hypothetical protein [Sphingobacterium kitahiroshimense]TCR13950.1 hypothetical protein EDF67_10153 [Sphingobacterium sp. JUb78]